MTREEELWAAIIAALNGDDVDVPVPAWRREEFLIGILGAIKGVDGASVPEPVWREEQYLKAMFDVISEGGGGSASYELLHSEEVTANTTSTSTTVIKTISLGADAYTGDKLLLVRIRDKAGPRDGYVYGSDSLFFNNAAAVGSNFGCLSTPVYYCVKSNKWSVGTGFSGSGYGVFAQTLYGGGSGSTVGDLDIATKYGSSYGTINGTFTVDVYLVSMPDGTPMFPALS